MNEVTDPAPTRLGDQVLTQLDATLAPADRELAAAYPGDQGGRQPVHTVYISGADYRAQSGAEWGDAALSALATHLPDAAALADVISVEPAIAAEVHARVRAKLGREPIEDLRIDFEDGYGSRADGEEDRAATAAGQAFGRAAAARPPFGGIRFKCLEAPTRRRGVRTLDLFLGGLLSTSALPAGFVVTLPKVTHLDQVSAFATICEALETAYDLAPRSLRFEIQVETPQSVLAADGSAVVARMITAGAGRVTGLHYGTYDYSAACGIAAPYQSLEHPVADYAKAVMQVAAAGTGVRLSDGSTNVVPVGSPAEIIAAWRLHARLVRRSLERGYYQGWDLHPLHLVTRYAATYAFYREGMPSACDRLRAYLGRTASGVMDEPATAQAMAALLVRGRQCGALDADEIQARSGVDEATLLQLNRGRRNQP